METVKSDTTAAAPGNPTPGPNLDDEAARGLTESIDRALAARRVVLDGTSNEQIIAALADAAGRWTDPDYPPRHRATTLLAERLNLSSGMLTRGIDNIFSVITRESLERLLEDEVTDASDLEQPKVDVNGNRVRLQGPRLVFYSLAGNVPGLGIPPIVVSLLARSAAILRNSSRQPALTTAFLGTLKEESPALAEMIVATTWPAGDGRLEATAVDAAQRLEIYGEDETIRQFGSRHGDRAVIARGSASSVAVVPRQSDTDKWAEGLALDVVLYEGAGCLTPKAVYVEGERGRADRMAKSLGLQLSRLEKMWPRLKQSLDDEVRRREIIGTAEAAAAREEGSTLLRGREDSWCIHITREESLDPRPSLRCIDVVPARDLDEIIERLGRAAVPIAAIGLGMEEDDKGYTQVNERLSGLGAPLICPPGRMQAPPIGWSQDGRQRLADLLQWRPVESASGDDAT